MAIREQIELAWRPMFIGSCARPWRTDGQSLLFITIDAVCSVRIGLGGTKKDNSGRFAISMAAKATAV